MDPRPPDSAASEPRKPLTELLAEALASFPEVRLAAAFGSVARRQERPGSDLDIGLRLDSRDPELRWKVEAALGRAAGREVDLVDLDTAPPLLRFEIARDGVLLLARERQDWVDFRARAMIDWWDWAPTARKINDELIRQLREKVDGSHGQG
jgi:predicted nucleotidyltransferase